MEIRVNIPDELATQARDRGLQVEAYIQQILAREVKNGSEQRMRTPEEIRIWLDSLAQFSDKIPPLPKNLSREWIYQDHE